MINFCFLSTTPIKKSITLLLFIVSSCTHQQEPVIIDNHTPFVSEAKEYRVFNDSLAAHKVIFFEKPVIRKAGSPKIIPTNTNLAPCGVPKTVKAGSPEVDIPGKNNFPMPKTVIAIVRPVAAGIPEVIVAKEAHVQDDNIQNFSSFGKLQGLKVNNVHCITQDIRGSLWFGTTGGVSKYDGKSFSHFTQNTGLPNNNVLSILNDKNNNLWIGTAGGGVSRYDGKFFTAFSTKEGLPNDKVLSILEDKHGDIWFGTEGGVTKFNGTLFTHYTEKEGLVNNVVYSICEDSAGNLWFGTAGGVSKYNGQSFSNITCSEGLSSNEIKTVLQDKSGSLWFGTASGADKFDGSFFTHYSEKEGFTNKTVYSIFKDVNGNLWFGTWGEGVFKYDGKIFAHYTENEGLVNNEMNCIFQDKSNIIWFGTRGGGVIRYGGMSFEHYTCKEGLSNNEVNGIIQDRKGNLWIGTWGGGVNRYDGKSFAHFTEKEGLINNDVRSILEDKDGNVWFGTWGGVSKFDGKFFTQFTEKEGLCKNVVISILQDKSGNLWFGTEGGGVSEYDGKSFINFSTKEGLSGNIIRSMVQDRNGNIWFATDRGITKFNPSGKDRKGPGSFFHFTINEGLSCNDMVSVLEDKSGNLWFGSSAGGVIKYDGKSLTHFTEKEGLCNNGIMSILEDKSGNLFFGTRTGISMLVQKSFFTLLDNFSASYCQRMAIFKNYTYEDGFQGVGCNRNAICEDNNGDIWIGANNRLTLFHTHVFDPDTITPNIQLTGIELFNANIPWKDVEKKKDTSLVLDNGVTVGDFMFDGLSKWDNIPENLSLAYADNFLTFNFICITTKSTNKVKYIYKLEGLDENWSTITNRTSAPYGNLPNGRYKFRVKAIIGEGSFSNEVIYNFTIRPPWWKSSWAYFIYLLGLIIGIFLVDRIQTRRVIVKERRRTIDRELHHARLIEKAYQELHLKNEIVEKQKAELENQKKCTDELLLNILPSEVAEELKIKGSADAQLIDEVSVLFTDFKEFTCFSERVSPNELVAEIHECFSAFDRIMQKHGVEKIKTIGDSYMAAGGLPTPNKTHSIDVVKAALEIQQFMYERKIKKQTTGKPFLEIRIGIHTGPVVAGIVGIKKFAYDIWGDTVNTASHMERSCDVGRVNISGATYELVKDSFNCAYRGKIEAKNKGMIDMYFVNCDLVTR
jgi:ligand-binding sensor domain-containing protein/class 3 adenylate cyclase